MWDYLKLGKELQHEGGDPELIMLRGKLSSQHHTIISVYSRGKKELSKLLMKTILKNELFIYGFKFFISLAYWIYPKFS